MTKSERFLCANLALVQVIDAESKLSAALSNLDQVLTELGIEHPVTGAIREAVNDVKIAKELTDHLCERLDESTR